MNISYRRNNGASFGDDVNVGVSFDIRPPFARDRQKYSRCDSSPLTVTGIPNLVELDDATLNTLDPGQLLRESAAAASRAALQCDVVDVVIANVSSMTNDVYYGRPRAASLVDGLLDRIYQQKRDDTVHNAVYCGRSSAPGHNKREILDEKSNLIQYIMFVHFVHCIGDDNE